MLGLYVDQCRSQLGFPPCAKYGQNKGKTRQLQQISFNNSNHLHDTYYVFFITSCLYNNEEPKGLEVVSLYVEHFSMSLRKICEV